jgi:hypothetical protein
MSLIWQAMGDEQPDPTVGNRGNGWFGAQRGRVDGIKVVPNPDPVRGPPLIFNYNLLHGDAYPLPPAVAYSGARSLSTPPSRLWFSKGAEVWFRWTHRWPASWVGKYPRAPQQGEVYDWLSQWVIDPKAYKGGGSGLELHHAHSAGGQENGSAPLYTGADDQSVFLNLINQADSSVRKQWLWPLVRERTYEFALGVLLDPDPAVGWLAFRIDGAMVVPKFQTATMYPDYDRIYPCAGLYDDSSIGDPNLVWTADAKPGVIYPPRFVPKKGAKVYPLGDLEPRYQELGGFAVGDTEDDVDAAWPITRGAPMPPIGKNIPQPPPAYVAPADPIPAKQGPPTAADLMAQRTQLQTILASQQEIAQTTAGQIDLLGNMIAAITIKLNGDHWTGG